MHRAHFSLALIAGVLGLGLVACGGAPTDAEQTGSSTESALVSRGPLPPLAPWFIYPSGGLVQWVDASGNATNNVTITYKRAAGTVQHTGSLSYTVWDDFDKTAPSENCNFMVYADAMSSSGQAVLVSPSGPILCNGSPYFGDMLPSYPYNLAGDLLAAAFSSAAGDSIPDVCAATNGRGTTLPTTFLFQILVSGETASTGRWTGGYVLSTRPTLTVTLLCE